MCGIVGWISYKENIKQKERIIKDMADKLSHRGPDDSGIYTSTNALLGHKRLVVVDPTGGGQPMTRLCGKNPYTIVYNGELYNTEEIRKMLLEIGYSFNSYSDTEVLLTSYIEWGEKCVEYFNGIYAFGIWDEKNKKLFIARDPLGVKPLFYRIKENSFMFASEIKALLAHPEIQPIVDRNGITELFALGPARALGSGIYKDIMEVKPGNYITYDSSGMKMKQYWSLKCAPHLEDISTTTEHLRSLLIDTIEKQLVSDVPVCAFLSGGLDSSAISAIASNAFKRENKGLLNTFTIDYEENDKYFKANDFEPNSDSHYIKKMVDFIGSNHYNIVLNINNLSTALREAVIANDLPGMADIDSSLYLFCKQVKMKSTVALSGECADEVFGGYPWYMCEEDINANTFPWSKSINERKAILSSEYKNLPIEEYVAAKYDETIMEVPKLQGESKLEQRMRELFYLNIKWFMITLLNRKDRMSMANSLEVRVPFADYRLVEYAFNIPKEIKFCDGREKGLLRRALKGILPEEIIDRKKSPYPKTHHPDYTKAVQKWMRGILNDSSSPILQLIDREKVNEIVDTGGQSFKKPWFGQLMTGPQLIAYLIQIDIWMKEYKIQLI